jgi:hypothetical protein
LVATPTYRGCAFINASAEGPRGETKLTRVCADSRAWVRGLFTELARDFGAADPAELGRQLVLLYDGATVASSMAAPWRPRCSTPAPWRRREVRPPRPESAQACGPSGRQSNAWRYSTCARFSIAIRRSFK